MKNGQMAKYMRNRRLKRRKYFIAILGGKCKNCEENDFSKLEFDHIDPKTKLFDYNRAKDGSMEKLEEEMKKIQLLCKKCHLEKTKENGEHLGTREPARHGTTHYYKSKGCRCDDCRRAMSEYRKNKLRGDI